MSKLRIATFDYSGFSRELVAFKDLLDRKVELSESRDVLPFFRSSPNLCLSVGLINRYLVRGDLLRTEMTLFGQFRCDLVVGDSRSGSFCFVEFEDAKERSIFRPRNDAWDYAPRFERGFSQLVDWIYLVEDLRRTNRFEEEFGSQLARYACLMVIGRDTFLNEPLGRRLRWRSDHTLIDSRTCDCVTYDELFRILADLARWMKSISEPPTSG